jgi:hypothetical protein
MEQDWLQSAYNDRVHTLWSMIIPDYSRLQGPNFIKFKTISGVFHSVGIPKVKSGVK